MGGLQDAGRDFFFFSLFAFLKENRPREKEEGAIGERDAKRRCSVFTASTISHEVSEESEGGGSRGRAGHRSADGA